MIKCCKEAEWYRVDILNIIWYLQSLCTTLYHSASACSRLKAIFFTLRSTLWDDNKWKCGPRLLLYALCVCVQWEMLRVYMCVCVFMMHRIHVLSVIEPLIVHSPLKVFTEKLSRLALDVCYLMCCVYVLSWQNYHCFMICQTRNWCSILAVKHFHAS